MPTITLRKLSPALVRRIKEAAARNGRSMEEEVRVLLHERYAAKEAVLERMRARRRRLPPVSPDDVAAWHREARERRD